MYRDGQIYFVRSGENWILMCSQWHLMIRAMQYDSSCKDKGQGERSNNFLVVQMEIVLIFLYWFIYLWRDKGWCHVKVRDQGQSLNNFVSKIEIGLLFPFQFIYFRIWAMQYMCICKTIYGRGQGQRTFCRSDGNWACIHYVKIKVSVI